MLAERPLPERDPQRLSVALDEILPVAAPELHEAPARPGAMRAHDDREADDHRPRLAQPRSELGLLVGDDERIERPHVLQGGTPVDRVAAEPVDLGGNVTRPETVGASADDVRPVVVDLRQLAVDGRHPRMRLQVLQRRLHPPARDLRVPVDEEHVAAPREVLPDQPAERGRQRRVGAELDQADRERRRPLACGIGGARVHHDDLGTGDRLQCRQDRAQAGVDPALLVAADHHRGEQRLVLGQCHVPSSTTAR
jgi:hypothetical protein